MYDEKVKMEKWFKAMWNTDVSAASAKEIAAVLTPMVTMVANGKFG